MPDLIPTSEVAERLGLARNSVWGAMKAIGLQASGAQPGRGGQDLWDWAEIQKRWSDPNYRPSLLWGKPSE